MAWEGPGLVPGGGGTPGVPGSVCPQGWDEDFDRSQMSTQMLIGRQPPIDVPELGYTWAAGTGTVPPAAGNINLNNNPQDATVMYVSKTAAGPVDATIWLNYLHSDCTVTVKTADNKTKGYRVTADPTEHATYFEVPISWTAGTEIVPPGAVDLILSIVAETPQLWQDAYGVDHYGALTFTRTDLINTSTDLFETLADRILEVRGSNSVPRLEAVTLDARTGKTFPMQNMELMSTAAPEKPSRYLMRLAVGERMIFDRMCFATAVRHFIARDEWTLRITLDIAEWAGTLGGP